MVSKSEDKRKAIQGENGSAEGAETVVDDIVTRLRNYSKTYWGILYNDTQDAALAIERLREEVEVWRKIAHMEHSAWSQCTSNCLCLSNDFRKAVRGE